MIKRKSKYPIAYNLEIETVAAEGKSLGHYNDKVIFVANTVPGDIVDVQINCARRRFYEGYVVNFHKKSDIRVEPFCSHFGECGGCKWQALPYEKQLEYKQQQVFDQLSRISGVQIPEIMPIIGSQKTEFYRNKLEFTFSNKRWISRQELAQKDPDTEVERDSACGFHVPGMFDKVIDIQKCYLQAEPSNAIRLYINDFAKKYGYEFYDLKQNTGLMRTLMIRTSSIGQVMVVVVFAKKTQDKINALMDMVAEKFPQITSLNYVVNEKLNDSLGDQDVIHYSGLPYIEESMEGLTFRINPKSFYQTNSEQAYNLYKVTREFAALEANDIVYDLYTGTGTIANFVAKQCKKVIGIEYVEEAIVDAKLNSQLNGIDNTQFFAGDMKDVLNRTFIDTYGKPNVIILDPPRAGIHEDVAKVILEAQPKKIVYVSCNPATQARDLAIFDSHYEVVKVQPVDMFPHTHHVENVVLLIKK